MFSKKLSKLYAKYKFNSHSQGCIYEILKQNKDRTNKFILNIINVNDDTVLFYC